jgi:membrane-bound inhibitor of C-type lysozyme
MNRSSLPRCPTPLAARAAATLVAAALCACAGPAEKEAAEAARNTYACQLNGERILIRYEAGEARVLLPGGDRVTLYQIASTSGVRYTNGMMELRGKGLDLQLLRDGNPTALEGCAPYAPPK